MLHFVEERAKCVRRLVLMNSEGYWSGEVPRSSWDAHLSRATCKHLLLFRSAQAAAPLACLARAVRQSGPREAQMMAQNASVWRGRRCSPACLQPAWLEAPCAVHAK